MATAAQAVPGDARRRPEGPGAARLRRRGAVQLVFHARAPRRASRSSRWRRAQREAAFALLHAGLSEKGYTKAEAIRALEPILAEIEQNPVRRDPELYYVTIFGDPSPGGTWGWRYEGHHISQNWTIVKGTSIASTPQFFGSNPAEVRDGPKKGTRVLHAEEDLARALLERLTDAQRATAMVASDAPDDILTSNARKAGIQADLGIAYGALTTEQRGLLLAVIDEYAAAQPRALAEERLAKIRKAGSRLGQVRVDGEPHPRRAPLLPRAGADVPHRVRQHAERREPRPRRVARLRRRLGHRPAL